MDGRDLNRLTSALREICGKYVWDEKWLIAPSERVGYQWLDAVARSGQTVLNVRIKTLKHMALDLASSAMAEQGLTFLRGAREEVLIHRIFEEMKQGGGYLSALQPGRPLAGTMMGVIRDLRQAELAADLLRSQAFEAPLKARDIQRLFSAYERVLEKEKLADYAKVLCLARDRLNESAASLLDGIIVLLPETISRDSGRLEKKMLEAVPPEKYFPLKEDPPGELPGGKKSDASRLAWSSNHAEAPELRKDGSAGIFRAIGEVNEVREIFRRCIEGGISFDDVEILYTDGPIYVPLIFEIACCLKEDSGEIPVTFYEGIPIRYSRPARALIGWLAWIREDRPQAVLARMIQDGLLKIEIPEEDGSGFERLAAALRTARIGRDPQRKRYLKVLARQIEILGNEREKGMPDDVDEGDSIRQKTDLYQKIRDLKMIREAVSGLMNLVPAPDSDQKTFLEGAVEFMEKHARCAGRFDEYSRKGLLDKMRELSGCLREGDITGMDVPEWLEEQIGSIHINGQGPRPGCLYAAPLHAGGHAGRNQAFIIGLDESRFPGPGLQDPLLLDSERGKISGDLPTAAGRLSKRMEDFAWLTARLRGNITLSYACYNLLEDREIFPGPVILSAYRNLSGHVEGSQEDFLVWLGDPVSFAPGTSARCIDMNEWWLRRLCGETAVENPAEAIGRAFPHIARGFQARRERESPRFTEYDGYVPEAGEDRHPAMPFSASRLELLGKHPMEYFFKYILDIRLPEDLRIDPAAGIDAAEQGTILHRVFREFMSQLYTEGGSPDFHRDEERLMKILDREIERIEADFPPPNPDIFKRDVLNLKETARIFLQEEETFCKNSRPVCFEAAIGLPSEGAGTLVDTPDPVEIKLPDGKTILACGRIDRLDEIPGSEGKLYAVWDYKTGGIWRFGGKGGKKQDDPFHQGRLVQGILYVELARARLREKVSAAADVVRFGYFFPNPREHGERISWESHELAGGKKIVALLLEMIRNGCFPFTDEPDDLKRSDYTAAFGDPQEAREAIIRKLQNPGNRALQPFRNLRGYEMNHVRDERA